MARQAVAWRGRNVRLRTAVLRRDSLHHPQRRWRRLVGERGLAPPRLTDSRSVRSAIPSEPLARNWCSRPDWLPKPCDMAAPNETVRYRELQSHQQPGVERGSPRGRNYHSHASAPSPVTC